MRSDELHYRSEEWPRSFYLPSDDLGDFHDFTWNRSEGHYECSCGRTEDELPEDAITDRLNELHPALEERSRIVDEWGSLNYANRINSAREYRHHVPRGRSLDGYHVVDRVFGEYRPSIVENSSGGYVVRIADAADLRDDLAPWPEFAADRFDF